MRQNVLFTNNVSEALGEALQRLNPNRVFVLVDTHTARLVLPHMSLEARPIVIEAGDDHKSVEALMTVWHALQEGGATRSSVLVNVGGGMVTDLGGMAAATFKRGIRFVNVPTTLLGAVDAAVGGKTGVNFGGLKNEVGAFAMATDVVVSTRFFATLPPQELWSGYAEMLKHAMLTGEAPLRALLNFDPTQDPERLLDLLRDSVQVKRRIVEQDPLEKGLRKALNLGHTVGHAFESLALQRGKPIPHGYAVAWGLVVETVLSHMECGFPSLLLHELAGYVLSHYGTFAITCDDYPQLIALMRHDKKSERGEINCSLLEECGQVRLNCSIEPETMETALDIYRDLFRI